MAPNNKFMVKLLSGVTPELVFALGWASIGVFFLAVVIAHQRKVTRRNFRGLDDGQKRPPSVTPRRFGAEKASPPKKLLP